MDRDSSDTTSSILSAPESPSWNESDFTAVVEQFEPLVLSICYRITGNRADAEDAAQATFLALAQHLRAGQRIDHLAAWLRGVARNCACHVSTAAARRAVHERQAAGQATRARSAEHEHRDAQALFARLLAELARLPSAQRRALELHYFEGQQLESISATLGVASGTVASWLSRARSRLRERLRLGDASLTWVLALGFPRSVMNPLPAAGGSIRLQRAVPAGVAGMGLLALVVSASSWLGPPPVPSARSPGAVHAPSAALAPPAHRVETFAPVPTVFLEGGYQLSLRLEPPHPGPGMRPEAIIGTDRLPGGPSIIVGHGSPTPGALSAAVGGTPVGVLRHPLLHLSRAPHAAPATMEGAERISLALSPTILPTLRSIPGGQAVPGAAPTILPAP